MHYLRLQKSSNCAPIGVGDSLPAVELENRFKCSTPTAIGLSSPFASSPDSMSSWNVATIVFVAPSLNAYTNMQISGHVTTGSLVAPFRLAAVRRSAVSDWQILRSTQRRRWRFRFAGTLQKRPVDRFFRHKIVQVPQSYGPLRRRFIRRTASIRFRNFNLFHLRTPLRTSVQQFRHEAFLCTFRRWPLRRLRRRLLIG